MSTEETDDADAGLASLRQQVVDRLDDECRHDLSAPLERCGLPESFFCGCCGYEHQVQHRCKRRYCPVCARMIAARFALRYKSTLAKLKWPLFVTWTAMHKPLLPGPGFPELFGALKKLRHQVWFQVKIPGGIASGEVSYTGENGWHRHLHTVIDCRWLSVTTPCPPYGADAQLVKRRGLASQREVARQWEMALSWPGSIKAQRCNGEEAALEILKYSVTPASLLNSPGQIGPIIDEIRRSRLVRSWGTMYGHLRDNEEKLPRPPCPGCNKRAELLHERTVDAILRRGAAG